ncbi:MAG: TldD/PmbA family protein [Solobacterium sp.]|nr:TldD/PmbA family protein [Solobacterium sp.]
MTDRIIELLKHSGADAWEVTSLKEEGWEFYFIRHDLDQNRAKKTEHIHVTVYKKNEDGSAMGSASMEFAPTESEENVRRSIDDLIYRASLVQSRSYELNPKKEAEAGTAVVRPVAETAKAFLETLNSVHETDTEDLNSYEIFTSVVERRYVNSAGADLTEQYPKSMTEVVVNARSEGHEIELYRLYHSGTCDRNGLRQEIEDTLQFGKDRLRAESTPQMTNASVIFSTDAVLPIYRYFLNNMSSRFVFRRMNDWQIGTPIADGIEGDTITLRALRTLENSSANHAYDSEGAPVRDLTILENSVPKAYWGDRQFCSYLGLEDTFRVTNWEVLPGKTPAAEIRTPGTLEVVEFSDFQADPVTGDLFGEIRLAYLYDENGRRPVSGGSVSGNLKELMKHMTLSAETKQYDSARVPAVTRIDGATVTGK